MTPAPGDILLFYNATGLNRAITWFLRSKYYHCAIYAGDGNVIEARPRGVVRRNLQSREGGHDFVVAPAPEGRGEAALAWGESKVGADYDRIDVVVIVLERVFRHLHLNYTSHDKFSCGEFVACAFENAGANLFPGKSADDIVPGDFARFLPDTQPIKA